MLAATPNGGWKMLRQHSENMATVLKLVGETLGVGVAWHHQGRFHFRLPNHGSTIAVSPESAGRVRIDACALTVVRDTRWVLADDRARLAAVISEMAGVPAVT